MLKAFYGAEKLERSDIYCARLSCQIWIARGTPPDCGAHLHKVRHFQTDQAPNWSLITAGPAGQTSRPAALYREKSLRKTSKVLFSSCRTSLKALKMRPEVERRLHTLLVIWSILVVSLGTAFPTRHKNVAHKVSCLHIFIVSLKFCKLQQQVAKSCEVLKSHLLPTKCFLSNNQLSVLHGASVVKCPDCDGFVRFIAKDSSSNSLNLCH